MTPDSRQVLRILRIALKFDSAGRGRVLGEIENLSDRAYHHLVLSFRIQGGSSEILAFPGLNIQGSQTTPETAGAVVRPRSKLEFDHWLTPEEAKQIKSAGTLEIKDVELTGKVV